MAKTYLRCLDNTRYLMGEFVNATYDISHSCTWVDLCPLPFCLECCAVLFGLLLDVCVIITGLSHYLKWNAFNFSVRQQSFLSCLLAV